MHLKFMIQTKDVVKHNAKHEIMIYLQLGNKLHVFLEIFKRKISKPNS